MTWIFLAFFVSMKENNLSEPINYHGDAEFETVCNAFNEMQLHLSLE